jgi:hypothetical protein
MATESRTAPDLREKQEEIRQATGDPPLLLTSSLRRTRRHVVSFPPPFFFLNYFSMGLMDRMEFRLDLLVFRYSNSNNRSELLLTRPPRY